MKCQKTRSPHKTALNRNETIKPKLLFILDVSIWHFKLGNYRIRFSFLLFVIKHLVLTLHFQNEMKKTQIVNSILICC